MTTFLIDFKNDTPQQEIDNYFAVNQCTVVTHLSNLNKAFVVQSSTEPPVTSIVEWVVNDDLAPLQLLSTDEIQITLNTENFATASVDTAADKDWWKLYSLYKVDFSQQNMEISVHKTDDVIFVIDSGIKADHPEFQGRRVDLFHSFLGTNFEDNKGHGTAMASLVNGNTCSMLDCDLKVVKVFDNNVATKQSDILIALNAIGEFILNNPTKLVTINMSWSVPRNQYIEDKIRLLLNLGAVVATAAGNSGMPIADVTPAGMTGVYTIGSYNSNFEPSNFSDYEGSSEISYTQDATNHGELDGWAPGENIYVATINNQYGVVAGTSASSAIFAASVLYNATSRIAGANYHQVLTKAGYSYDSIIIGSSLARQNLLDLNDPKYEKCPNLVTTYFSQNNLVPGTTTNRDTSFKAWVQTGKVRIVNIIELHWIKSYQWINPVPDWVKMEGSFLVMDINTEPVNDLDAYTLQLRVIGDAGSYIWTIDVAHLRSDLDFDTVPPDDPVLEYDLTTNLQCFNACQPSCSSTQCCGATFGKFGTGCYCQNFC